MFYKVQQSMVAYSNAVLLSVLVSWLRSSDVTCNNSAIMLVDITKWGHKSCFFIAAVVRVADKNTG